jgi:hypothetical protein
MAALLVATLAMPAFAASQGDFTVVNNTSMILTHLYVQSSESPTWGDDILGRDVLGSGETADVTFTGFDSSSCLYDVKVVGQTGGEGTLYKIDLCVVTTVTFSDAA